MHFRLENVPGFPLISLHLIHIPKSLTMKTGILKTYFFDRQGEGERERKKKREKKEKPAPR